MRKYQSQILPKAKQGPDYTDLPDKVRLVKSSFGKLRLELDMDPKDFEKLKQQFVKE